MQQPDEDYSTGYQWYVVLLLTIAATLSFIDRQILNVMIGPIKRDLGGLSDTEISLIIGLAFSLVYTLATVPLARWADRRNRRNVIVAGIFCWSLMTALAGMANNFWKLFVARMGVGIGEAALGPATTSILPDYFKANKLPLAFGCVGAAPFIGTGLANILGGPMIDWLESRPNLVIPVFGELFSWQMVLITVGLPGILLSMVMFTVKEPARKGVLASRHEGFSYSEVWAFMKSRRKYLSYHFLAYLFLSAQGYAYLTWIVELFVRKYGWTRTDIGLTYGIMALVVGVTGAVGSGWLAGRLIGSGRADGAMRVTLWSTILLAPIAITAPLVDSGALAMTLLIPITFSMSIPGGLSNVALQAIAPNQMRGQLIAAYQICVTFLAYLFAPLIVGAMNDYLFGSEDAIDLSLATSSVISYSVALTCLVLCLKPLREAVDRIREQTRDATNAT